MKRFWTFGDYRSLPFWLAVLVLLCAFAKAFLVGKGFLAFPDETRVFASANLLNSIADGNVQQAVTDLFSTRSRPGAVLVNIVPVVVQFVTGRLSGLPTFHSANNWPFFSFNLIIYLGIIHVLYRIVRISVKDKVPALIGALLFACLTNGYLYLRHTLPYDKSLLIFLVLLYQVIKSDGVYRSRQSFWLGLAAFFGFLVYPGYILMYAITGVFFFLFRLKRNDVSARIQQTLIFALGGGLLFGATELLSRVGDISYWGVSREISSMITHGDFSESFSFLFTYLVEVEGALGILVLMGMIVYFTQSFRTKSYKYSPIFLLGVLTIFFWALYAGAGYFFHKVTLYGRLIHQFLPVFCVLAGIGVWRSVGKIKSYQIAVFAGTVLIALSGFLFTFLDYFRYEYPLDAAWHIESQQPQVIFTEYCEIESGNPRLKNYNEQHPTSIPSKNWYIVNACFIYPVPDVQEKSLFIPPPNSRLVYERPYFQSFKPYRFEGLSPIERERMRDLDLKIKVYQVSEK